ncbi:WXG100 family type VII secretion target [Kitasatospora cathayae]|uniref:Excreted virulence factor EspC (Type VII ESX diderm) n=1 Tax=Kitasatospora cathayae TaxID=3004092 RepID=A0ABY7Q1E8_9ACTN|nr:hypothetical protein [Kitasatospora sp. HUAS 3-15]WBP86503.1 hypothetical protein O1G21_12070 [Kitasatospora sp. HUAS 3-15]
MADFTVSPEFLAKLAKDLKGCGDELDQGLQALKGASRDGLGFDFLEEAGQHFQEKWEYGLKKVRECVKVLDEGLEKVQQSYAGTEQNITKALTPAQGQS